MRYILFGCFIGKLAGKDITIVNDSIADFFAPFVKSSFTLKLSINLILHLFYFGMTP